MSIRTPDQVSMRRFRPFLLKASLGILFAFALSLYAGATLADIRDHIVDKAYFVDASGTLGVEDVARAPFGPAPYPLVPALTSETVWIRLTIDGDVSGAGCWVLRADETYLERIELYDGASPGTRPHVNGFLTVPTWSDVPSLGYTFKIPTSPTPRHLYLRIRSGGLFAASLHVVSEEDIHSMERSAVGYSLITIVMAAILAVTAFVHWRLMASPVLLALFIKGCARFALLIVVWNYPRLLFGDSLSLPALLHAAWFVTALSVAAGVWFMREYLVDAAPGTRSRHLLTGLLLVQTIVLLGEWLGLPIYSRQISAVVWWSVPIVAFIATVSRRAPNTVPADGKSTARWFGARLGEAGLLVMIWISWRPVVLTVASGFTMQCLYLVSNIVCVLFVVGLTEQRARLRRQEALRLETELSATQRRKALADEQRREKEMFLAMLSHEIEKPLRTLRILVCAPTPTARVQRQATAAIDTINGIIDRCNQAERIGSQKLLMNVRTIRLDERLTDTARAHDLQRLRLEITRGIDTAVRTDPDLIGIIVSNLIDNALKYGDTGSVVDCSLRLARKPQGEGFEIAVTNRIGTAGAPDPRTVFEKYQRGRRNDGVGGSGLGLFIAKQLAQRVGGDLTMELGTRSVTFSLWMPRTIDGEPLQQPGLTLPDETTPATPVGAATLADSGKTT